MEWKKVLEEGRFASRAFIAKELGISQTRVTQILNILRLPADQLQKTTEFLSERKIRLILKMDKNNKN